jgi:hypothetical protein
MKKHMRRLVFVETPQDEQQGSGQPAGEGNGGEGKGFTPPASQEELNRLIADRISRERAKYADYDDLKAKATQLDAIEEANKTEAQKQADALAAATKELEQYKQREQVSAWKSEIVKGSHIPADLLRGSTQEELLAHFEQLKGVIPESSAQPQQPVPGLPSIGQQPPPGAANVPLRDQIAEAEKLGDRDMVARLKALQLGQKSA